MQCTKHLCPLGTRKGHLASWGNFFFAPFSPRDARVNSQRLNPLVPGCMSSKPAACSPLHSTEATKMSLASWWDRAWPPCSGRGACFQESHGLAGHEMGAEGTARTLAGHHIHCTQSVAAHASEHQLIFPTSITWTCTMENSLGKGDSYRSQHALYT